MKKLLIYIFVLVLILPMGCSNNQLKSLDRVEYTGNDIENDPEDNMHMDIEEVASKSYKIEVVLEPSLHYSDIKPFSDGLAVVSIYEGAGFPVYGYINEKGEEVISPKYIEAYDFQEGFAVVLSGSGWTFINKEGNEIIKPIIGYIGSFSEGLAVVEHSGVFHGYIDIQGNRIITLASSDTVSMDVKIRGDSFKEGLALVYNNETKKYGYIDKTGNLAIPFEYDEANSFQEGVAMVRKNEVSYFIDKDGNKAMDFFIEQPGTWKEWLYSEGFMFSDGLAYIYSDGKGYYIDKKGNIVIDNLTSTATPFYNGIALIGEGGFYNGELDVRFSYIDRKGNPITDFDYYCLSESNYFSEGVAFAWHHDLDGIYINQNGEILLTGIFGEPFNGGYAPFQYQNNSETYISYDSLPDNLWGILRLIND